MQTEIVAPLSGSGGLEGKTLEEMARGYLALRRHYTTKLAIIQQKVDLMEQQRPADRQTEERLRYIKVLLGPQPLLGRYRDFF